MSHSKRRPQSPYADWRNGPQLCTPYSRGGEAWVGVGCCQGTRGWGGMALRMECIWYFLRVGNLWKKTQKQPQKENSVVIKRLSGNLATSLTPFLGPSPLKLASQGPERDMGELTTIPSWVAEFPSNSSKSIRVLFFASNPASQLLTDWVCAQRDHTTVTPWGPESEQVSHGPYLLSLGIIKKGVKMIWLSQWLVGRVLLAFRGHRPGVLNILKIVLLEMLTVPPLGVSQSWRQGQDYPFPEQFNGQ